MSLSLPSALQHNFAKVQTPQNPRSSFDRSFTRKTTFRSGFLIPVYVDEVLPGDTINMNASFVARISTLLNPIMDNLHLDTFWFFCPNRILWDNWKRFNGERPSPGDSIDFVMPYLSGDPNTISPFSMGDYFGLPIGDIDETNYVQCLPFRMYNRIYNDWFRSENTQNEVPVYTDDGPDNPTDYQLMRRGKRHDYFTSALPWPQKGDAVPLPIGSTAPVIGDGNAIGFSDGVSTVGYLNRNDDLGSNAYLQMRPTGGAVGGAPAGVAPIGDVLVGLSTNPLTSHVYADLTSATATTINDLREAIAIQQLLELDARGGTRYIEQLKSMWGVTVPDFRLQRPEYLGGSSERMGIHAVPQQSATGATGTPQGNLSAFGQMSSQSGFTYSAVEHGYVMCLVNVRADITYQQGLHRMWTRQTRYDFYQPPLAHLGEQAVLNREIYFQNAAADLLVFGYQERWAEYRYAENRVTAAFRSNYAQTLDSWHLALNFNVLPELEDGFLEDDPPINRITAVTEAGEAIHYQLLLDMYASSRWARIMPVYSTPGLDRL